MRKAKPGQFSNVYDLTERNEQFLPPPPPPPRPPYGQAPEPQRAPDRWGTLVLVTGLISLGLWPIGPIGVCLGIMACAHHRGLHGSQLWQALTGTLAAALATFGLLVWLVAKVTLRLA